MNAIYLMLAVGIPVLLLFGGALLAFAVAHPPTDTANPSEQTVAEERPAAPVPLVFFQPVGWSDAMQRATADEIVASIEAHLKAERRAAQTFVKDPSNQTLWVD